MKQEGQINWRAGDGSVNLKVFDEEQADVGAVLAEPGLQGNIGKA